MKIMKYSIAGIFGIFLITMGVDNSAGQWSTECHPIPNAPNWFSPYMLHASGYFFCAGWQYWSTDPYPYYTYSNNCYTIRLESYLDLNYAHAQVLTPWEMDVQIGARSGFYPEVFRAQVIMKDLTYGGSVTTTTAYIVGPQPTIFPSISSDANIVIRWGSYTNLRYSVQYSTQLTANSWKYIPAFSNVSADSSSMQYQAPISNAPLRIYRLISAP